MEIDVLTFACIAMAQNAEAAKAFLWNMTLLPDENYAKGVVGKAVGLCGPAAREWVEGLF